jgi:predicted RNase H-like HicB family nuclease
MIYRIVLVKSEEGYSVSCPILPGCWSQGDTEQEAIDNIREAIGEYKASVADTGLQFDVREMEIAA